MRRVLRALVLLRVEAWQPGGERVTGFTGLGLVAALLGLVVAIGIAFRRG